METASEAMRKLNIRAAFPSREYLAARIEWTGRSRRRPRRRSRRGGRGRSRRSQRRIAQEPGVVAVTFADRAAGITGRAHDSQRSSPLPAPSLRTTMRFGRRRWARDSSRRSIGRSSPGVRSTGATGVPLPERSSSMRRSRARFRAMREADRRSALASGIPGHPRRSDASAAEPWFEIVGVVRDVGLDPDDSGNEQPYVFHAASAERCLRS